MYSITVFYELEEAMREMIVSTNNFKNSAKLQRVNKPR